MIHDPCSFKRKRILKHIHENMTYLCIQMELFTYIIDKDMPYYKGSKTQLSDENWSKPMWIGHETTAQKYGQIIYGFKTSRQLKMINIYSGLFQNTFH